MKLSVENFLTPLQQQDVICAIKLAELQTSGEIRLHIENNCPDEDVLDRAAHIFAELDMHETKLRNGVLFYVAVEEHLFAILGDMGINCCVDECFWEDAKELVLGFFQRGEYTKGLVEGIAMAGEKLKEHFPYQKDDVNELSDDISFGN